MAIGSDSERCRSRSFGDADVSEEEAEIWGKYEKRNETVHPIKFYIVSLFLSVLTFRPVTFGKSDQSTARAFRENESRKENVYSVSWVAFFMFLVFAMIKIDYQVGLAMNGMDSPYHYRVP